MLVQNESRVNYVRLSGAMDQVFHRSRICNGAQFMVQTRNGVAGCHAISFVYQGYGVGMAACTWFE
jgi:hypothetical protein